MLLHVRRGLFSSLDLENVCVFYCCQFGVLVALSNTWFVSAFLGEDPIKVWGGFGVAGSIQMNVLLADVGLTSFVSLFVPIRASKIWIVPAVIIAPFVFLMLWFGGAEAGF